MGYSRKIQTVGAEDTEFPGVLKNWNVEIPGVNTKRSGISKGDQEKIIWNFHGSWFLVSEIPIRVTQFCGISRGEDLFSLEFKKVK